MAPQRSKGNDYVHEPIAIIGSGCRFPGESSSPSKLWDLLREPRDVLTEIPTDRFNPHGFYHPDGQHHGTSNVREAYLLSEDHRHFDAYFFGMKGVEVNSMDPQQRVLLETVYESIEAAGLTIEGLQGSDTAVYVGLMCGDYSDMMTRDPDAFPTYFATGTARSIMSNRVSYFFDWHGPSMTIDTACSSSLIAVHQAAQVLRAGDCRVAVAAGSNLILGPEPYIAESKLKMLSPTGRSRMWDADADGYARGDGVAAVVLKTLSAALEDGDQIECLIRETGTNQDGRSKGITMPSAAAQTALIRSTYAKAGLDLNDPRDRPQYFEAHGTGTPTGDPIEAKAICDAFYGPRSDLKEGSKLFVGSIKTVIGHTEGTAGLAGLLKASLAIQHGIIPPNLLLNRLNLAIVPFYAKLEIPTAPRPWPAIEEDTPRRVSVNSFGFGGSNAHAILESYEAPKTKPSSSSSPPVFTPFTFSAVSERSLAGTIAAYSEYLKAHHSIDLRHLSYTLNSRRSVFPVKAAFSAVSVPSLCAKLEAALEVNESGDAPIGSRSSAASTSGARILGVFTGQGAQWARMGAELISRSKFVQKIIERLERSLSELPASDRPTWSLKAELLAGEGSSRLSQATLAQPLCTAVQIVLVDLLRAAGIRFEAVVGHSSGEIGAAYAAGYLSVHDAIRVAYYRGFHAKLASGPEGKEGAMMAVGTSLEDAKELCELPDFQGRITVAASNSSASVTISGDADAIEEAKAVFEEEKKFARLLKVDKAYHSHHMFSCSDAYLQSLRACDIKMPRPSRPVCSWFSSVYCEEISNVPNHLRDGYWNGNLISPVMFSQAIESAIAEKGSFDAAIEIGPHPALKGPATQTIQDNSGETIPYTGVLSRGQNDIEAFADGLGFLWTRFGEGAVDFTAYDELVSGEPRPRLLKNLPTYSWDHGRVFWHESRLSRAFRTRQEPVHELLGSRCPDGAEDQVRWRNLLRPKEVPWLHGHQIQGQMVFPGAGYVSTALEAARALVRQERIRLIEVYDLVIGQAMIFDDDDSGVETLFTVTDIAIYNDEMLTANFSFYSSGNAESSAVILNASGRLQVLLGQPSESVLPPRGPPGFNLIEVESERFYASLDEVGFEYSGPFRVLTSLKRKLGAATGRIVNSASSDPTNPLMVHPAMLDCAIQSVILAYCWPGDGRLWSIHVPTRIRRITVNPFLCGSNAGQGAPLHFESAIGADHEAAIDGDVEVYAEDGQRTMLQVEGMHAVPFSGATPANDFHLFSEMTWDVAMPDGKEVARGGGATADDYELAYVMERVAYFYMRNLDEDITQQELDKAEPHHKHYLAWVTHMLSRVAGGADYQVKTEWLHDTHDQILEQIKRYPESIDLKVMHTVGEHMPAVIRGETTILEHLVHDNMLDDYYVNALGFHEYTKYLARMVGQIAHRYPHMDILEIGAGTGGATKSILKRLDRTFSSYTFTDISSGFFEKAMEGFKDYKGKMTFKTLDAEKDITAQGYAEHSYDLVIASLVLHATHQLEDTLKNVRHLLKPGGYLVMLEITNNDLMRLGFIFGSLPGWWFGYEDGRPLSPCITTPQWNTVLKRTGFAGVESATPDPDILPFPLSVIAAQAVDDRISFLRQPLSTPLPEAALKQLTILGGATMRTSKLVTDVSSLLAPTVGKVNSIQSLEHVPHNTTGMMPTLLSLIDLDDPVFKTMTPEKLEGLKKLFENTKRVLWITQGSRADEPYSNMSLGFGRTLLLEMPHLHLQFIDIEASMEPSAPLLVDALLRFEVCGSWQQEGQLDGLLWTIEPELAWVGGQYLIPRLLLNKTRNNRYNSSRRLITKDINPRTTPVGISCVGTSYVLEDRHNSITHQILVSPSNVRVQISHSVLRSLKIPGIGFLYLVLGVVAETSQRILTLSESQASVVEIPENRWIPCPGSIRQALQFMLDVAAHLRTLTIVSGLSPGDTLVVLEPDEFVACILGRRAASKGIRLICLTTRSGAKGPSWTFIHPHAPKRAIRALLPAKIASFVNMSGEEGLASRITESLPSRCKFESRESLTANEARVESPISMGSIPDLLKTIWFDSQLQPSHLDIQSAPMVTLQQITDPTTTEKSWLTIVDWAASVSAAVRIRPVDWKPLFAQDKTYWLVGLTGGLGQSLCEWMIRHGARYAVLTSRNPKVDKRWLESTEAVGATVKVFSSDITDRHAVQTVYREISSSLPPVGGVAQGAMVLHDTLFLDLSFEKMQKVLRPKVDGSIYLNELFADTNLDFFVFFSSMACVTGNGGQSIYSAANMFMAGLAAQRRKRGQAASVINIGAVIGNGYVTREVSHAQQVALRNYGNTWMSEQDFHQIFAEGVLASRVDSVENSELMTGLRLVNANGEDKTTWFDNPKFQHLIMQDDGAEVQGDRARSAIPVKSQLLLANSKEEVLKIVEESFKNKLRITLQLGSDGDNQQRSINDLGADELGIDSLVAVEIRSWFLKELDVDVPVLKILGGASIGDLISIALEKLPEKLVPNLGKGGENPSSSSKTNIPAPESRPPAKVANPITKFKASKTASKQPSQELGADPKASKTASKQLSQGAGTGPKPFKTPLNQPPQNVAVHTKPSKTPFSQPSQEPATGLGGKADLVSAFMGIESAEENPGVEFAPQASKANLSASQTKSSSEAGIWTPPDRATSSTSSVPALEQSHDASVFPKLSVGDQLSQDLSSLTFTKLVSSAVENAIPGQDVGYRTPDQNSIGCNERPAFERTTSMSFGQTRFWFLKHLLKDQTTFNITCSIRLKGTLRIDDLAAAVRTVGQRHEALRTCFFTDENDQPIQAVLQTPVLHLERKRIADEIEIAEEYKRMKEHVFDLEHGETMRILLLSQSPTSHQIIIAYHHINMDGLSLEILLADVQKAYNRETLSSSVLQYPDFALRQKREYSEGNWKSEMIFWRSEFPDFPPPLPLLPLARRSSRPALTKYAFHSMQFTVDAALALRIRETCRKLKATPFHFYLAAYKILLVRFLNVDDLCIGIADGNRNDSDMLESIGFYLNLLPLRFRSSSMPTFGEALKEARAKAYSALSNSRVPFDVLLNDLGVPRSATHNPLFQVFLNYRQGVQANRTFCDCESDGLEFESGRTAYDLNLDVIDYADGDSTVMLMVQKELYTLHDAEVLSKCYLNLLEAFSRNPALRIERVALYSAADVEQAIELGRGPIFPSRWPETIAHRVDTMVGKYGNKLAIKDGLGNRLTYSEMATRANTIAAALDAAQIGSGSRVGVFQEPSAHWVCSLLAIMRIGAIYLPLDPRSTTGRLAAIVKDCQPIAILVHSTTVKEAPALNSQAKLINISSLPMGSINAIPNRAEPEAPAAIIYTSGSTGVPKGIVLKHSSLRNNTEWATQLFNFNLDAVLQQSSFSFDMSLSQILIGIANGGSLYIASQSARGDPIALAKIIASEGISFTQATPSEYTSWLQHGGSQLLQSSSWRIAISGGEQITQVLKKEFQALGKPDLRLFNGYGPTEITFTSNSLELPYQNHSNESEERVPGGFTWPTYSVRIVDENLNAVPVGIPGEILIGGAGVAWGYLNNQELTAQRFIPDEFASAEYRSNGWTTMHRTGDRGRLRRDGALMIEGRIQGDTQIKLRGQRIELRDIESTILQAANGALVEAVVSLRSYSEESQFLVAHVEFSPSYPADDRDRFLRQLIPSLPLPQYMRPAMVIPLDHIPMNSSLKLDRLAIGALPLPQFSQQKPQSVELNDTEVQLIQLWGEVIPRDVANHHNLSSDSDFFNVGGSSLLLVNLRTLIQKQFDVDLPLVRLFEASTLGGMAALLGNNQEMPKSNLIDWDSEIQPSSDLSQMDLPPSKTTQLAGQPKVIVLTGATGFVGKAILRHLLEDDNIKEVHCIAVRQSSNRLAVLSSRKLVVHTGDLTLPRFGLSGKDASTIFGAADAIIHNGADVSFLKTFHSLKQANVESTKELIRMSLPHRIPFHYISSASVAHLSGRAEFEEISAAEYRPPEDGSDGYTATKWVCERYLEKVSEQFSMPVWIHRPSSVTGEDAPALDIMTNLLNFSRLMKAVPLSTSWHGYFDFISVDLVAQSIVREVCDHKEPSMSRITFLHHSGELEIPVPVMKDYLEREAGAKFETLPLSQWAVEAKRFGLDDMVAAYLSTVDGVTQPIIFPRLLRRGPPLRGSPASQSLITQEEAGIQRHLRDSLPRKRAISVSPTRIYVVLIHLLLLYVLWTYSREKEGRLPKEFTTYLNRSGGAWYSSS